MPVILSGMEGINIYSEYDCIRNGLRMQCCSCISAIWRIYQHDWIGCWQKELVDRRLKDKTLFWCGLKWCTSAIGFGTPLLLIDMSALMSVPEFLSDAFRALRNSPRWSVPVHMISQSDARRVPGGHATEEADGIRWADDVGEKGGGWWRGTARYFVVRLRGRFTAPQLHQYFILLHFVHCFCIMSMVFQSLLQSARLEIVLYLVFFRSFSAVL